ncbi:Hpt domain-containing protein [Sphingomonas flavalba]|uniref:Hpt domain-containing protein n=1 Tax=Sphingomonas flavalba TaxID=2559804 RepID=UPI00109DEA02|nr:Hpt domain-containing protein [Sphingomonas flavalba]
MSGQESSLIDWAMFQQVRAELGADFVRILGYFREDGAKALTRIEEALRAGDAAALVVPAHTLKGEARQFGAGLVADSAETIEMVARRCVEMHQAPDELIAEAVRLKPLFAETLAQFDRETNPLVERRPAFGRKAQALAEGMGAEGMGRG